MKTTMVQQFKEKHESLAGMVHVVDTMDAAAAKIVSILEEKQAEKVASIRGAAADSEAFIGAMHNLSGPVADEVIQGLAPFRFPFASKALRRCPKPALWF